ncbi:MAG: hybrid sensor histidine kinase/response regulator [Caldimonas sp.]
MRTPLNAVIGFSELLALQDGNSDPNQARYLEHILDAGRHLLALVDDVLDLQRVDERRLPLVPRALDLADFVSAETKMLVPLLVQKNLTMQNDVPGGLVVRADEKCLRQALLNLATNAIKYNRPSGAVHWTAAVQRPGFARLMLSDTGQGMTGEQIPRLFQPFDRLGMETAAHGGSGLGVLIAKGLVEYMGGRLEIESKLGVGTHVTIELPLAEPHSLFGDLDPVEFETRAPIAPSRFVGLYETSLSTQANLMPTLRLLYVEDNRINAMLFEAVLGTRPDIELRIAETGWEALGVVESWIPDVLVLDANLPDIHGIRLLRQMRESEALKSVPAFMCSADAMEEDVQAARDAGFTDYWTKPIDFGKVILDLRRISQGAPHV